MHYPLRTCAVWNNSLEQDLENKLRVIGKNRVSQQCEAIAKRGKFDLQFMIRNTT